MRLKTEILSCILGIAIVNGVCVATQQPIKKDAETQGDVIEAQEKWFKAVESNDLTEVTRMIEASEINPNVKDNSKLKETALHIAAKDSEKSEIAKFLINHPSVNVNAANATGATPLFEAIKNKNDMIIDLLLAHKEIDVRVYDDSSTTSHPLTPTRLLIRHYRDKMRDTYLPYLKNKKIKLTNIEYRDMKNLAIEAPGIGVPRNWLNIIVEHMLDERTAPYSKKDQLDWSNAVLNNDLLKMEELIKKGVGINSMCFPHGTALHNAVSNKNIETINFLLKNGADVNIYGSSSYTPLRIAVIQGDKEILELLLKHPKVDVNDPQDALLLTAVQNRLKDIVELLLSQEGININLTVSDGWTPLHAAAHRNNSEIIELLLQQDEINVNAVDNKKKTPLHIAAENNNKDAAELLLKKKTIDVAVLDVQQLTPLDTAIQLPLLNAATQQSKNTEITLLLLKKIKEKGLKISDATCEKIKQKPNLCGNDEILGLANELKQNTAPAD
jgi:ankyrin repeat protein